MQSTHSLPGLGVVAPVRVLSIGQIEQTMYLYKTELLEIELFITIEIDLSLNNL